MCGAGYETRDFTPDGLHFPVISIPLNHFITPSIPAVLPLPHLPAKLYQLGWSTNQQSGELPSTVWVLPVSQRWEIGYLWC